MATQRRSSTAPELQQTIVREFQGGWNTINNELNLSPSYAKVMDNWWRGPDGSMQVRYGYSLFADAGLINASLGVPLLPGTIVNGFWFQGYLIVVDTNGIVAELDPKNSTGIRVFDATIAAGQIGSPSPWSAPAIVNFFSNSGKLIILNGIDPPLIYDHNNNPKCQYLADPASGSNFGIPKAAYGISDVGYAVLAGDSLAPTTTHFSSKYTNSVYVGNTHPDDAVDIDMSKITSTVDAAITGLGQLRGTLVVTYKDGLSLGTLGAKNGTVQDPKFDDQVSLSGCIAHRSIVSLGSDMFLCDRVGVPSLSRSTFGQLIPDRVSQLIEPDLQRNIARLSDREIYTRVFAVFNPRERQYMLFMPKFTYLPITLPTDPIALMVPDRSNSVALYVPNHQMEEGDQFTLSGATDVGPLTAANINKQWTVTSVIDENTLYLSTTSTLGNNYYSGGGSAVVLTHVNVETIGYIFTYNPKLKIQCWARYRGMAWNWGCVDVPGRVYFGLGNKIYRYGTVEDPVSADRVNDYDYTWTNNTQYKVGDLVADTQQMNNIYICNVAHTSTPSSTFAADRQSYPSYWSLSKGTPINFAWEWPWGDFGARSNTKAIRLVKPEAQGRAEFTMSVFVDNLYSSGIDGVRTPVRAISFVPNEAGGFGRGSQPYGGGRRTREMRPWPTSVNCNTYKLRFEGSTTEPLRIVSVSLLYHKGGLGR